MSSHAVSVDWSGWSGVLLVLFAGRKSGDTGAGKRHPKQHAGIVARTRQRRRISFSLRRIPDELKRAQGFDGDNQAVLCALNAAVAGFIKDLCDFVLAVQVADDEGNVLAVFAIALRIGDEQAVGEAGIKRDGRFSSIIVAIDELQLVVDVMAFCLRIKSPASSGVTTTIASPLARYML